MKERRKEKRKTKNRRFNESGAAELAREGRVLWIVKDKLATAINGAKRCRDGWRRSKAECAKLLAALREVQSDYADCRDERDLAEQTILESSARRCETCNHWHVQWNSERTMQWVNYNFCKKKLGYSAHPKFCCSDWEKREEEDEK